MSKYVEVGRAVRQKMLALTPQVEPLSIDEAFLDLTGTERLHGMNAAKVLAHFAMEIERDLGITISIGLSANKFLAKIASDMDKPRGFAVLGQSDAVEFLAPKPVGFIWGVGAVSAGSPRSTYFLDPVVSVMASVFLAAANAAPMATGWTKSRLS